MERLSPAASFHSNNGGLPVYFLPPHTIMFSLPTLTGRDLPSEIEKKRRMAAYRRKYDAQKKCRGSNSCDCPKCR